MTKKPPSEKPSNNFSNQDFLKIIFGDDLPDNLPEEIKNKTLAEFFEIDQLEVHLGLPGGFFTKLLDEDDWSFIIKLHALIEAAITHLLVKHFDEPALDQVFSFLELSNLRTGKLAFANSIGLIDTDTKRFIHKLSEMRNEFVHNVTNVNIEIKDFLDSLDKGTQKGYRKGFLLGHQQGQKIQIKHNEELYDGKAVLQLFCVTIFDYVPKLSIWFGSIICLSDIYKNVVLAELRVQKQELNEQLANFLESLVSSQDSPDDLIEDEE